MTDDERAIRELVEAWMACSKAGDLSALLDLMTDDVIFLTPGGKPFGKEAFAAASKNMKNVAIEARSEIPSPELICQIAAALETNAERLLELAKTDELKQFETAIEFRHESALLLYRKGRNANPRPS